MQTHSLPGGAPNARPAAGISPAIASAILLPPGEKSGVVLPAHSDVRWIGGLPAISEFLQSAEYGHLAAMSRKGFLLTEDSVERAAYDCSTAIRRVAWSKT